MLSKKRATFASHLLPDKNKAHLLHFKRGRALSLLVLFLFLLPLGVFFIYQKAYQERIYPGVRVGDFDLAGFTKEKAAVILRPLLDDLEKEGFVFKGESPQGSREATIQSIFVALTDPDLSQRILSFDLDEIVKQSFNFGREGNLLERIKAVFSARAVGYSAPIFFQLNESKVIEILEENFHDLEKTPQQAVFLFKQNEGISFIPEKDGYTFNYLKAIKQVKENISQFKNEPVVLVLETKKPTITLAKIQFFKEELEKILKTSPFILKYNQQEWTISEELLAQWLEVIGQEPPILDLNFRKVSAFLDLVAKDVEKEPVNAKFKMASDKVIEFQASKPGLKIDFEQTFTKLKDNIFLGEKITELVVKIVKSEVLTEDVNQLGIKELVGQGESDFRGSPKNRIHNIKIGAGVLNGFLIKPGEEFSLLKALGEVSEKVGYLPELVIKGNRTIPELGGGLCQIGTTAFRVALTTGVPITQRAPHAFRVIYYEPAGVDATIYHPRPDFRFINDYPSYLLLQTKIERTKLIFEFYGTPDGRQVELSEPKIFNLVPPGPPLYIETTELLVGEKKRVERAVAGADTEFRRTITYANGEIKKEVWKSHYRPWREVWLVGVEKPLEETMENIGEPR